MRRVGLIVVCLMASPAWAAVRDITLTPAEIRAVGLVTVPATAKTLTATQTLFGRFQVPPRAVALVSSPIAGRVTAFFAAVGSRVRVGGPLVRIMSLLVGNPPPSLLLRAPLAGIVASRKAVLGQIVGPGTPIFRVIDTHILWLRVHAYQDQMRGLAVGLRAQIHVLGDPRPVWGSIVRLAPQIDPRSGTETVWIAVANVQNHLRPRLFARARVALATVSGVVVPSQAVLDINGQSGVFVAQPARRYRYTVVRTGIRVGRYLEVRGLPAGAKVVTVGAAELYSLMVAGRHLRADS
ncbi:MAG: efflux RND transporter periplasmic adaptor subunit [Acidiferrobacter sp.]